jgi:hypothetical protein
MPIILDKIQYVECPNAGCRNAECRYADVVAYSGKLFFQFTDKFYHQLMQPISSHLKSKFFSAENEVLLTRSS